MYLLLQLRGQAKIVVSLVLAAAALALGIIVFIGVTGDSEELVRDAQCHSEVKTHALQLKLSGDQFAQRIKSCGPEPVTIRGDVKKEIAMIMARTKANYDVPGDGEIRLFEGEHLYCQVYRVIDFEEKGKQIEGFTQYLMDEELPGKDQTYIEFLEIQKSDRYEDTTGLKEAFESLSQAQKDAYEITIDTDKTYAVTFVYAKGHDAIERWTEFANPQRPGAAVAGSGIVVGGALVLAGSTGVGLLFAGGGLVLGVALDYVIYKFSDVSDPEWLALTMFTEYDAQSLASLGCDFSA